jgi:hypothetical protein
MKQVEVLGRKSVAGIVRRGHLEPFYSRNARRAASFAIASARAAGAAAKEVALAAAARPGAVLGDLA